MWLEHQKLRVDNHWQKLTLQYDFHSNIIKGFATVIIFFHIAVFYYRNSFEAALIFGNLHDTTHIFNFLYWSKCIKNIVQILLFTRSIS